MTGSPGVQQNWMSQGPIPRNRCTPPGITMPALGRRPPGSLDLRSGTIRGGVGWAAVASDGSAAVQALSATQADKTAPKVLRNHMTARRLPREHGDRLGLEGQIGHSLIANRNQIAAMLGSCKIWPAICLPT